MVEKLTRRLKFNDMFFAGIAYDRRWCIYINAIYY